MVHFQQFIGLCGYNRKFIENFAGIAAPLYSLLRYDKKWIWTQECQEAFDKIKTSLTTYQILRHSDFYRPFAVQTDACGVSICAILTQMDDNSQEHVIAYASRLLKGAELHYGITEKECLAVIWAI